MFAPSGGRASSPIFSRATIASALVAALAANVPGTVAADTISYFLTASNLKGFDGPFARVTVDRTSPTTATITFESLTNGPYVYLIGGRGAVDVNVNGPFDLGPITGANTVQGFTGGSSSDGGVDNGRRIGFFNLRLSSDGGWPRSSTEVSFDLTASGGSSWDSAAQVLLPNDRGQIAAIHLFPCRRDGEACAPDRRSKHARGFADGAVVDPPVADLPPVAAVPLPAAAWLFGSGLVGLIALARRRGRADPPAPAHGSV